MREVFVDAVEHMTQMIVTLLMEDIREASKLTVEPAGSCSHERVLTRQL